jgi:hypothetical protein
VLYIPSSVDSSTLVVLLNVDPKNADLLTIQDAVVFTAPVFTNSSSSPDRDNHDFYRNTSDVVITTKYRDQNTAYTFHHGRNTISTATAAPTATDVSGVSARHERDELEKIIGDYADTGRITICLWTAATPRISC